MGFDFEFELKKIPTKVGLVWLSNFSKKVYLKSLKYPKLKGIYPLEIKNGYVRKTYKIGAWNINEVAYDLIKFSNDERNCKLKNIDYNMFRLLNDLPSNPDAINKITVDNVWLFLQGMGDDQFKYQSYYNVFNDVERNIYIFVESNLAWNQRDILTKIINDKFGCTIKEYLLSLLYIFTMLTSDDVSIISLDNETYFKNVGIPVESIKKILMYYSISYKEIRESELKHLILKVKPFVRNKEELLICPNIYNMVFAIGNALYWVIRDYYKEKNSKKFLIDFGVIFENYFYDLFVNNGLGDNIKKVKESNSDKMPDFVLTIDNHTIVFECKSTVPSIESIQQDPDIKKLQNYYVHIQKAYEQMQSYIGRNQMLEKEVLKVIVEFTHDKDESLLKKCFSIEDDRLIFMNITHIETLCDLYMKDRYLFNSIIDKLFDIEYLREHCYSIKRILNINGLSTESHFKDRQYCKEYVDSLINRNRNN